jgi:hypothetical protein
MSREQLQIAVLAMHLNEPCFPLSYCSTIVNNMYEMGYFFIERRISRWTFITPNVHALSSSIACIIHESLGSYSLGLLYIG